VAVSSESALGAILLAALVLIGFAAFFVSFVLAPFLLLLVFYVWLRLEERSKGD
jgi:uncharacterized membrane protein YphA (DoxX/SURF4 family)